MFMIFVVEMENLGLEERKGVLFCLFYFFECYWEYLLFVVILVVSGFIVFVIYKFIIEICIEDVCDVIVVIFVLVMFLFLLFIVFSFVVFICYDINVIDYVCKEKLLFVLVVIMLFSVYVIGNMVGFGVFLGGVIWFWVYLCFGLIFEEVGKVVVFVMLVFGFGILGVMVIVVLVIVLWLFVLFGLDLIFIRGIFVLIFLVLCVFFVVGCGGWCVSIGVIILWFFDSKILF